MRECPLWRKKRLGAVAESGGAAGDAGSAAAAADTAATDFAWFDDDVTPGDHLEPVPSEVTLEGPLPELPLLISDTLQSVPSYVC